MFSYVVSIIGCPLIYLGIMKGQIIIKGSYKINREDYGGRGLGIKI